MRVMFYDLWMVDGSDSYPVLFVWIFCRQRSFDCQITSTGCTFVCQFILVSKGPLLPFYFDVSLRR